MNNKNILIIIIFISLILLVGFLFYLKTSEKEMINNEENKNQQQEEQVQEEEEIISNNKPSTKEISTGETVRIVEGMLFNIEENYFVIDIDAIPSDDDVPLDPKYEPPSHTYKKIRITDKTKLVDVSAVEYLPVPNNISGSKEILNYLKSKLEDYNFYIVAGYPLGSFEIDHEGDVATYIEWTSWPKNE